MESYFNPELKSSINFDYLQKIEIYKEYNNEKRAWHEKNFSYYLRYLHYGLWEDYVFSKQIHSPFFQWFELVYAPTHDIEFPFKTISSSPIFPIFAKTYNDVTSNHKIISNYPPKKAVIIEENYIGTPLIHAPKENTTHERNFQNIIYQNNYTNEILFTIGEQLDRIENKISEEEIGKEANIPPNNIFFPHPIDGDFNLGNKDVVDELERRLKTLNITNNINTLRQKSDISDYENSSTEDENIEHLTHQFTNNKDTSVNMLTERFSNLNKIHQNNPKPTIRNYWSRPSLPDIQIEERPFSYDRSAYDGTSVYEWNIDGYSEHQILNIVTEINMAANAYKSKGNTQIQIVNIIISGFTGTLKGWWDIYVTPDEKLGILCHPGRKTRYS